MQTIDLPQKDNNVEINYQTIVNFLSLYIRSKDYSVINPTIQKNSLIFNQESQLPELWIKTKCPINKNLAFYDYQNQLEEKKSYPGQIKKPSPFFFPKTPFTLPSNCELEFSSNKKNTWKKSLNSANSLALSQKKWLISIVQNNKLSSSGPFSTEKIKSFLNFNYMKLNERERNNQQIMIVDIENDVLIGQVATKVESRGSGYAREFLKWLAAFLHQFNKKAYLLALDIRVSYYREIGFREVEKEIVLERIDVEKESMQKGRLNNESENK